MYILATCLSLLPIQQGGWFIGDLQTFYHKDDFSKKLMKYKWIDHSTKFFKEYIEELFVLCRKNSGDIASYDFARNFYWKTRTYLNIKMKSSRRRKKLATLSNVRSKTTNCLLKAGMNRTSLRIRNNRNVRNTDNPVVPPWATSNMLIRNAPWNKKEDNWLLRRCKNLIILARKLIINLKMIQIRYNWR